MADFKLDAGYFRTARTVAPAGTREARRLAMTLAMLEADARDDRLPLQDIDEEIVRPPNGRAYLRRVEGTALAVMFTVSAERVYVRAIILVPISC